MDPIDPISFDISGSSANSTRPLHFPPNATPLVAPLLMTVLTSSPPPSLSHPYSSNVSDADDDDYDATSCDDNDDDEEEDEKEEDAEGK
ncbi:unnamed protein product [Schistocephalus solidus]|uniref:Uncharacterized protein n=1 Tax=Schistocephalus solidus TaxID=70667 RepID=A0A183T726_SCHSO|nr:unnamed protein product [Schistocephalus solidus]